MRRLRESLAATATTETTDHSFSYDSPKDATVVARRGVLVRVSPEIWRQLKIAAIERGVTMQALLLAAITEELRRPNSSPPTP